ncbi:MAG TPA: cobaltochelatase subunit CobN, partial [Anaerolineae bacterium]|nr:cobaltochelatase subunit CobN [Anaerolineae bacterium]
MERTGLGQMPPSIDMRRLATLVLAWLMVIAMAPGFALTSGEEEVRVLVLAQKPARPGKLDAWLAAASQAGVTADYRFVGEADVGISLSELARVDMLIIDSPYTSKLAGVMAALDSTLKAWGKPVLFVPRRGYIPALHLGETHGRRLSDYYQHGGEKNRQHFFAYLKALLSGTDTASIPSPLLLPDAGIYHPDHQQGVFADAGAYLRWRGLKTDEERPVIGVAIHRSYLVDGIVNHIDATVRRLEQSGALPLVYYHPARNGEAVKKLLSPNGKTIPHAIINYRAVFDAAITRETFGELGIPVLQALVHKESEAHWKQDSAGWPFSRIPFYLAQPETAGIIDPMLVAVTEKGQTSALDAQLDSLVRKALRLAQLKRKSNENKRIAILYYNSPPGGTHLKASFLNVPRSLERILGGMSAAGYKVDPLTEHTLTKRAQAMLEGYHQTDAFERLLASGLAALLPLEDYLKWFEALPEMVQARITARWGEPSESRMLIERKGRHYFIIPRMASGSIVILPQPLRGGVDDNQGALQHDKKLPLNHSYLATYLWLREHLQADALIHLGTHGTQEWAPGKERALAVSDDPFLAVGEVPVIYPFIVDDVGEAVQAKRRGRALIISHQTPPFRSAGLYHELSGLHELVQRYEELDSGPVKAQTRQAILSRVSRNGIYADMGWKDPVDTQQFPHFMEELHHYLHDLAEAQQPLGLHSFGQAPLAEHLTSTVMQMLGSDYLHAAGGGKEMLAQDY